MEKREAREYIGTNHHFNPSMNPSPPPKQHWWTQKPTQPIKIQRQTSTTSEGSGSPTISPSPISPSAFSFPAHKPEVLQKNKKVFKSFDFVN